MPLIKFMFRENFKALNDALQINPPAEVVDQSSSADLAKYLSTIPAGLVLASLKTKEDLIQIASLVKMTKKVAQECTMKVVVINFSGEKNFEKAVVKLGITDLIEQNVNPKALKYKIDFWMKSLTAQTKLKGNNASKDTLVKAGEVKQNTEEKKDLSSVTWIAPLDLEDDIWLIKNEAEAKKILGKWLIRLVGPGPYVGNWYEVKPSLWRFDIKENQRKIFVPNEGSWYFSGEQKPDFLWKENNWLINGEGFELFFQSSKGVHSRLKSLDKILTISKNSLYAKTKEQSIIESFDKDLVYKLAPEKLANMEGENKTENLVQKNLKGNNKTEQLDHGNLKGKTQKDAEISDNLKGKNKTDHLAHENLEQKNQNSESEGGNLQGLIETEIIDNALLEQKANNKREKTFWNGKSKYDKDGNAEFGLKTDEDNNLSSPDLEAPLTDQEVEKYYKNQNKSKKENSSLEGKSQTDEISTHYDSGEKNSDKKDKENPSNDLYGKIKSSNKPKSKKGLNENGKGDQDKLNPQSEHDSKGATDKLLGPDIAEKFGSLKKAQESKLEDNLDNVENIFAREKKSDRSRGKDEAAGIFEGRKRVINKTSENYSDEDFVNKANDIKAKEANVIALSEVGLDELTQDANVTCFIITKGKKIQCELSDYFDDTIIFLSTPKGTDFSSRVTLDLSFKLKGKDNKLSLDGTVTSVDDDGEGNKYVTIQLSKENTPSFEVFMKLYESRQSNVNEFLKRARGF